MCIWILFHPCSRPVTKRIGTRIKDISMSECKFVRYDKVAYRQCHPSDNYRHTKRGAKRYNKINQTKRSANYQRQLTINTNWEGVGRRYKRTCDLRDWEAVLRLAEEYRTQLSCATNEQYHNRLQRASHQDGSVWPLVIINGAKINNKQELVNHLAEHFKNAHELPPLADHHLKRTIDANYQFLKDVIEIPPNNMPTDIYETPRFISKQYWQSSTKTPT